LRRLIVIALVVLLFFGGKKIPNLITLDSYISTLLLICLSMGIVFEIPVLSWLLARMGLLSAAYMRRYRRHAVVIILVLAAIITPTSDVLTLLAVSLPMWLLYEFSILLVARTRSKTA
jgi:twin arginine-targeting protein translocase tatC